MQIPPSNGLNWFLGNSDSTTPQGAFFAHFSGLHFMHFTAPSSIGGRDNSRLSPFKRVSHSPKSRLIREPNNFEPWKTLPFQCFGTAFSVLIHSAEALRTVTATGNRQGGHSVSGIVRSATPLRTRTGCHIQKPCKALLCLRIRLDGLHTT